MPGMGELLIILLIVLLIFGASKLPQIGDSLGRSIRNFKRATNGSDEIEVSKKTELEGGRSKELADPVEAEDAELVRGARKAKKEA
jgi:sec-independent protein translocase protein TatA